MTEKMHTKKQYMRIVYTYTVLQFLTFRFLELSPLTVFLASQDHSVYVYDCKFGIRNVNLAYVI